MSTGATYQFNDHGCTTTVYVHQYGYPQGAAAYFLAMHHVKSSKGRAVDFIRSNGLAEITKSHGAHEDTEYQYTIKKDGELKAVRILRDFSKDTRTKEIFFTGQYTKFINLYGSKTCTDFKSTDFKSLEGRLNEHPFERG